MKDDPVEEGATKRPASRAQAMRGWLLELEGRSDWTATDSPIVIVRAPGRVNLIGEHTDYNEGFVLPAAIDRETWIAFRPMSDRRVELNSRQLGASPPFDLDGLDPSRRTGTWIDYVAGTAWSMQEAGLEVRGLRGIVDSTVPVGSGLSSSAALEMAAAWALMAGDGRLAGARDDPLSAAPDDARAKARLALIAQRAENAYVGVNCGIMDQYASSAAREGSALLLDCRTLEASYVRIPEGLTLVVCDTSSPHRLEASQYNARRAECERAAAIIGEREPGVRALRDVDEGMLERYLHLLPETVARRAEHIVSENRRVRRAVDALAVGDLDEVGSLFAASHESLRDLFEVSSPELDALVEIATSVPGVVGARMTGGGFGGCTVNLVRHEAVGALRNAVMGEYPRRTGLAPKVYVTRAVGGAGRVV